MRIVGEMNRGFEAYTVTAPWALGYCFMQTGRLAELYRRVLNYSVSQRAITKAISIP